MLPQFNMLSFLDKTKINYFVVKFYQLMQAIEAFQYDLNNGPYFERPPFKKEPKSFPKIN